MVDVTGKPTTRREAVARGFVSLKKETLDLVQEGNLSKGDVLAAARVAGILAAKQVHTLIPLCHPLLITAAEVTFAECRHPSVGIAIESRVKTAGQTGAEMEALTAVAAAALTIYDMCKAVDKGMTVGDIRLVYKTGGRSGRYRRPGESPPARYG
jgi:cyclic pyranopterin phosphate synthase